MNREPVAFKCVNKSIGKKKLKCDSIGRLNGLTAAMDTKEGYIFTFSLRI